MPWSRVQPAERRDTGTAVPGLREPTRERPEVSVTFERAPTDPGWPERGGTVPADETTERPFADAPSTAPPPAPAEPLADPEQALAAIRIEYDPQTLHER